MYLEAKSQLFVYQTNQRLEPQMTTGLVEAGPMVKNGCFKKQTNYTRFKSGKVGNFITYIYIFLNIVILGAKTLFLCNCFHTKYFLNIFIPIDILPISSHRSCHVSLAS